MKKSIWLLALVCLGVAAASGWFAAQEISRSEASRVDPTVVEPEVLTVGVEERALGLDIFGRATVEEPKREALVLASTTVGNVVSFFAGSDSLDVGNIALELNGQPVFAIEGGFPLWRNLYRKDQGRDVQLVEAGLTALGFLDREPGNVVKTDTLRAFTHLLKSAGYPSKRRATVIPQDAFLTIESLPSAAIMWSVGLGSIIGDAQIGHIAGTSTQAKGQIDSADSVWVNVGSEVFLDDILTGSVLKGAVTSVVDTENGVDVQIDLAGPPTPEMIDRDLRLRIPVELSVGEVLLVPAAALSTTAAGVSSLELLADSGPLQVEVIVGATAQGYVEIESTDYELVAGDQVIVGYG